MSKLLQYLGREGISQASFAQSAGLSRSYLNEIAHLKRLPSLRAAQKIDAASKGEVPLGSWPTELGAE